MVVTPSPSTDIWLSIYSDVLNQGGQGGRQEGKRAFPWASLPFLLSAPMVYEDAGGIFQNLYSHLSSLPANENY